MPNGQDEHELQTFRRFAAAAQLGISPDSIQKRQPPEPDIQCELSGHGRTFFELVEVIDSQLAQAVGRQISFQDRLPEAAAQYQLSGFDDALIFLDFEPGNTAARISGAIPRLMEFLQGLPEDVRGNVSLRHDSTLNSVVGTLRITRGSFAGPFFQVGGGTFISDPVVERIRGKFNKRYATGDRLELLVFYEMHPTLRVEYKLPDVDEFVRNNLHSSQFSRVWVFDVENNAVLYRS